VSEERDCACASSVRLIFACSGASDVGSIADGAARALTREEWGKMLCLAGIGGRVSGILQSAQEADEVPVIDGCPQDCAKKTMELADICSFAHLRLSDKGWRKASRRRRLTVWVVLPNKREACSRKRPLYPFLMHERSDEDFGRSACRETDRPRRARKHPSEAVASTGDASTV
jgi:uncharacterized metal-binding protein